MMKKMMIIMAAAALGLVAGNAEAVDVTKTPAMDNRIETDWVGTAQYWTRKAQEAGDKLARQAQADLGIWSSAAHSKSAIEAALGWTNMDQVQILYIERQKLLEVCLQNLLVRGTTAIVNYMPQARFLEEVGSKDGKRTYWRFVVTSPDDKSAVIVLVPSMCEPKWFGAYVTVAMDAVGYYASGEIPEGDPITVDVPVIDKILATKGNHFLGTCPNVKHTMTRWLFYVEAHEEDPAVVVSVPANLQSANQFTRAYWTALDAVRWYINAKKSVSKEQ
jgi:hypothetical protein